MRKIRCIDPTVGDILAGWRYDISGLHPEMRTDYEEHLRECRQCHTRQRIHRTVDMLLIGISTCAIGAFVSALLILHRIEPLRDWVVLSLQMHQLSLVVSLERVAVLGLLISLLVWIVIALITPVPTYLSQQARALQERLPEELREHLPKLSA
ncbi:MAG TPA: hypothetical protein VND66_07185 [Acidobacteriaceae bacterium]|nr:hypothetical protein [Acidobacteriaceae bacterium]